MTLVFGVALVQSLVSFISPGQNPRAVQRVHNSSVYFRLLEVRRFVSGAVQIHDYWCLRAAKGCLQTTTRVEAHARNALVPLLPIITNGIYLLIGGSVFVEWIFNVQAWVSLRRGGTEWYPSIFSLTMVFFLLLVIGMNIVQDFLYVLVNPRASFE